MRHFEGMDVGERVRVKLVATDARKGWIDFEGVGIRASPGNNHIA
jgi:hypothetical protein